MSARRSRRLPHQLALGGFAVAVAALLAAAISAAADRQPEAGGVSAQFLDWFAGWWVKVPNFLVGGFRPDWAARIDAWISGPGRFPVAFVWVAISLYASLGRVPIVRGLLDRLLPVFPTFLDPDLVRPDASTISAFCEGEPFVARDAELADLIARASNATGFGWTAVVGRMGMGKTRLALEAMKALRQRGWDVGLLDHGVGAGDLRMHRFRRPTAILIDDWSRKSDSWELMRAIAQRPAMRRPVHFILCDQIVPAPPLALEADVITAILAGKSGAPIAIGHLSEADARTLAPDVRESERRPLMLKLGEDPWAEIRRRASERLTLAAARPGGDWPRLLALASLAGPFDTTAAERLVPGTTDLATLELLFEGDGVVARGRQIPALTPEMLAQELFLQWLSGQTTASDKAVRAAMETNPDSARERLLAMAAERPEASLLLAPAAPDEPKAAAALRRATTLIPDGWRDFAGQELDRIETQSTVTQDDYERVRAILILWGDDPELRLRCAKWVQAFIHVVAHAVESGDDAAHRDWSLVDEALATLATRATETLLAEIQAAALRCAASHTGHIAVALDADGDTAGWVRLDDIVSRLDALADRPDASSATKCEAATAHRNAIVARAGIEELRASRGEAPDWSKVDDALVRIDQLARDPTANDEVRLECARGYVNAVIGRGDAASAYEEVGEAADWSPMRDALAWLVMLAERADATDEIRLECARGHRGAAIRYGAALAAQAARGDNADWSDLHAALARLDILAGRTDATDELRLECAMGYVNVTLSYGLAILAQIGRNQRADFTQLRGALDQLDSLADATNATDAIRLRRATGLRNAVSFYAAVVLKQCARGEIADWTELRAILGHLDMLADRADATDEIRLQCAFAHLNATVEHVDAITVQGLRGDSSAWLELQTSLSRVDALAARDEAPAAMRLQCAKIHMNATVASGSAAIAQAEREEAVDWSRLDRSLAQLDALAEADDASDEILEEVANGHRNAVVTYDGVGRAQMARSQSPEWNRLRSALDRIEQLAKRAATAKVREQAWRSFAPAEGTFRLGRQLADAEHQRRRLKKLGLEHPEDLELQQMLEQHFPHLTYIAQTRKR